MKLIHEMHIKSEPDSALDTAEYDNGTIMLTMFSGSEESSRWDDMSVTLSRKEAELLRACLTAYLARLEPPGEIEHLVNDLRTHARVLEGGFSTTASYERALHTKAATAIEALQTALLAERSKQ